MTAYTLYPDGWFHRTPRAKMHAVLLDEAPVATRGFASRARYPIETSLCGRVTAEVSPTVFTPRGGSVIHCAACSRAVMRSEVGEIVRRTAETKARMLTDPDGGAS